jgi:tagatose-1,6-bisphosphate aldolase
MTMPTPSPDLGKMRSLQRVSTEDGFFVICALDHLSDFQALLAPDPKTVDYKRTIEAKIELIRALNEEVSAFLLDARFGLAPGIAARALPGSVGLMASIEDEGYGGSAGARKTKFREKWGTKKIKMIGADVCKLLWLYRPDANVAGHQRDVVKALVDECAALSLPLVVEPIWYPLAGEDPSSATWKRRRIEGIVESAHEAASFGVDMLKVEFPGDVGTAEGRDASEAACRKLAGGIDGVPWVILSAGVGFDAFKTQVEIACRAGASGFLAGRSIWRDAAATHDPAARRVAAKAAAARLRELGEITRSRGRPYVPALESTALAAAYPEFWYERWHA